MSREIPCQFTEKLPNTQPFWLVLDPIKDLPGYPKPPKGMITQIDEQEKEISSKILRQYTYKSNLGANGNRFLPPVAILEQYKRKPLFYTTPTNTARLVV
ncbi:23938_t:CDS:2, partial [Gigaspora margarita]